VRFRPATRRAGPGVQSVGIILGPYRNLTSLTAGILSLHPHCQVLNHAGPRLLHARQDFLGRYSDRRLDRFCEAALSVSTRGQRGGYGGSIRYSHAFDREDLQRLYDTRFGDQMMKDDVRCLIWKESQFVTNRIRESEPKIGHLLDRAPRLRFLMPVRNPLDCARSNMRTDQAKLIPGVDPDDAASVVDGIVEEIAWFARLASARPDRFLSFFEDVSAPSLCDGLVRVLDIEDDREWRDATDVALDVKGESYEHPPELRDAFRAALARHFDQDDDVARHLAAIVEAGDALR
jgi:hypothetical protein